MGIVMGYWDCAYCNTKGIGGDTKICPNCGMTRNENTRFYMNKNMPVRRLSDEDAQKVIEKGPDWICAYCDALNPSSVSACETCGAPRDNTSVDYLENKRKAEEEAIKSEFEFEDVIESEPKPRKKPEKHREDNSIRDERIRSGIYGAAGVADKIKTAFASRGKAVLITILSIVAIAAIILLGVKACAPREATMLVTGTEWSYGVEIEEYKTVRESDWSIPSGGRLVYTLQEVHHYDPVIDHYETRHRQVPDGYEDYVAGYEDMGNGYMKEIIRQRPVYRDETYEEPIYRQEPVYATKYYYDIERWTYDRTEISRGFDKLCRWPDLRLDNNERTGRRTETYKAIGTIDGKNVSHEISKADFDKIEDGMELRVVLRLGRKMEILWEESKNMQKIY